MTTLKSYFTFGTNHYLPDGANGDDEYVVVIGPEWLNHRALFMSWLGSNAFASEYSEDEWTDVRHHYQNREPHTVLQVTQSQP